MTTKSITAENGTPIGTQENDQVFSISAQDRPGILYVFGRTGQGKSVMLESLVISDIRNGRGGMFIDPYGDLNQEIQTYIPSEKSKNVVVFEAHEGTADENIARFDKEVDLTQMHNDEQMFLLCTLDYRTLGTEVASTIGREIVKRFLKIVGGEQRTIGVDEAHNFLDAELMASALKAKENGTSFIFADQMVGNFKEGMGEKILKATDHVLCYFVDTDTANTMSTIHPELSVIALAALKKYHFLAKVNAQTPSPTVVILKGILPKDLPQL